MKLKSIRVKMFRNILDSSEVPIQDDVTCLVGKNESGKTSVLQALWRLRPARSDPGFSVADQYPAWLEKRHRLDGQNLNEARPIEVVFRLEDGDREVIAATFGDKVVPTSDELSIWKTYSNKYGWRHGCNERQAVANFLVGHSLPEEVRPSIEGTSSFAELAKKIAEQTKVRADDAVSVVALEEIATRQKELLGDKTFDGLVWTALEPRIPHFLYFADYSRLPYSTKIARVLTTEAAKLSESEATAVALLRLGGAESEYLTNPSYERRKRELENVANVLTEDVLQYWTQNQELRVQPEITQVTEQKADGQHSVLDELKIRIWDNRHSLSLPFNEHSAGFQWFFSFLAAFSEYERRDPPVVILLDEPAVGLHARAQADFLRFIEQRLAKRCQVLYTTHSPFMVQPGRLERVRFVEDRGKQEGSIVSSDVLSRDPDTLFPLQGALGYDLVQHLFVAEHNLVVEGTSDYTYLLLISDFLASQGRTSLDQRWSIVPVGGADAIPTFVALLRNHLNVTVVVDSRKEGHQRLSRLASDGYLEKQRIILLGEVVGKRLADIEDLFTPAEYLGLYNSAFSSALKETDLVGTDPIVTRIARHIGVERFDHGKPADVFLRTRDRSLSALSDETLKRFELLFDRINKTL